MKICIKIALFASLAISSINAYAIGLNITIDPSLLASTNSVDYSFRVYTCQNQPICKFNPNKAQANKQELVTRIPAEHVEEFNAYLKNWFASFELPARSVVNSEDSFIAFDIIQNGAKLNLPGCTKVVNGMSNITVSITPAGCSIA